MIITALQMRIQRARRLIQNGAVQRNGGGPGSYDVDSESKPGLKYHVQVETDLEQGLVLSTHCQCPDWATMDAALDEWVTDVKTLPHPGIAHIHYSAVCKHAIAALMQTGLQL